MSKSLTVTHKQRTDTASNWSNINPILQNGELGIVSDASPVKIKIGDGTTAWNSLADFKISKAAIESVLTGEISSHSHSGSGGGVSTATITSMANMPIDKDVLYINLSSAQSTVSFTSNPTSPFTQTWFIKNTSGSTINQGLPNTSRWLSRYNTNQNIATLGLQRGWCSKVIVDRVNDTNLVYVTSIYDTVQTGDILCSDRSIVTASEYPTSGKTGVGVVVVNTTVSGSQLLFSIGKDQFSGQFLGSYIDLDQTNYSDTNYIVQDLHQNPVGAPYFGHTANMWNNSTSNNEIGYYVSVTYSPTSGFYWRIPTMGEWWYIYSNLTVINSSMSLISGTAISTSTNYWTSSEYDQYYAWRTGTGAYPWDWSQYADKSSVLSSRAITYH